MGVVGQTLPPGIFEMVFTFVLVVGALLFAGAMISFAVFAYRSVRGDGMKDPRETVSENADDDSLTKGGADDEWDFY